MAKKKKKKTKLFNLTGGVFDTKPSLTFGRPIARTPEWENQVKFQDGLMKLMGKGYKINPEDFLSMRWWGNTVASARNIIVEAFLERGDDYLIFFDDDMTVIDLSVDVEKMLDLDKDIVGAIGYTKGRPHNPNISKFIKIGDSKTVCDSMPYRIYDWPEDKPFEVDIVGTAFMCIKRKVIQKMAENKPLFYFPPSYVTGGIKGEDTTFCFNAKMLGFEIWVDPTIKQGHIGPVALGQDVVPMAYNIFKDDLIKDTKRDVRELTARHNLGEIENFDYTHNLVPSVQEEFKQANGSKRMFV